MARTHFGALDWGVLIGYLALSATVGLLQFRKQEDAEDYLLAGRRFRWGPVALSVVATLFSALSFVGVPAEAYKHGLQFYLVTFTLPLVAPIVILVFLPLYDRLRVLSAYEYLERRFNLPVRLLASGMFILLRIAWMASMTYTTALILREISGLPMVYSIAIMGAVTMLYTVTGGMAAVVWTDVLQFFVFIGGMLGIALILIWRVGGIGEIFAIAAEHDKLCLVQDFSLDFHRRLTFWGLLIGVSFVNLDYYGVDQMVLQRYFSARDKRQARHALIFNACFSPIFGFVLYFIGLGLFAFYMHNRDAAKVMESAEHVLPHFIVTQIPAGLAGLIVAAVFAATMSSISAGLNSLATATVVDFYERLRGKPANAADSVTVSRIATAGYGVLILTVAYLISFWENPAIIELTYRLSNPFTGATLGLFLIGLFSRRVPGVPAFFAAIVGMMTVSYVIFWHPSISFLWYSAISCVTTVVVGVLIGQFWPKPPQEKLVDLTVFR